MSGKTFDSDHAGAEKCKEINPLTKTPENGEKADGEVIEDAPYTVKVVPSHADPFELQVS